MRGEVQLHDVMPVNQYFGTITIQFIIITVYAPDDLFKSP